MLPGAPHVAIAVSATTRGRRPGERDGHEYHFLSQDEFERSIAAGEFVEHVSYAGNRYGTLRSEIDRRLADDLSVILEIELEGARALRRELSDSVSIFIAPPSMEELSARLRRRGTDSAEEIEQRLATGRGEVEAMSEFDHRIVNADVETAAAELAAIIDRETRVAA